MQELEIVQVHKIRLTDLIKANLNFIFVNSLLTISSHNTRENKTIFKIFSYKLIMPISPLV